MDQDLSFSPALTGFLSLDSLKLFITKCTAKTCVDAFVVTFITKSLPQKEL